MLLANFEETPAEGDTWLDSRLDLTTEAREANDVPDSDVKRRALEWADEGEGASDRVVKEPVNEEPENAGEREPRLNFPDEADRRAEGEVIESITLRRPETLDRDDKEMLMSCEVGEAGDETCRVEGRELDCAGPDEGGVVDVIELIGELAELLPVEIAAKEAIFEVHGVTETGAEIEDRDFTL